jgi:hypothetical protein
MKSPETIRAEIEAQLPQGVDFDALVAQMQELYDKAPATEREKMDLAGRGALAREFSINGYRNWYWCVTRWEYPDAHLPLITALIEAKTTQKAVMVQAWRGFGKTFDLLIFVAWLVGLFPVGSTGYVQINDTKAQKSGDAIADLIEKSTAWKYAFPNVIPDKETGWSSSKGYNVQDINVTKDAEGYARWRDMCFADHGAEASLMCAGIKSGDIIGWHPSNGEYFDDLHDEGNTRSKAEMQEVVDIFEGNIIPTWFSPRGMPILACVCTPWDSDADAYHAMLQTGLFKLVKIPIFVEDENGETFAPLDKKVKLAWPENFNMDKVVSIYNSNIKRFYQMYLLDDKAAQKYAVFKWQSFRQEDVQLSWPIKAGVDPVYSIDDQKASAVRGLSYFALCYLSITPMMTGVITGGVLEQCSAQDGASHIASAQTSFLTYVNCWCENAGGGQLFQQLAKKSFPGLRIIGFNLSDISRESKSGRQYSFLSTLFQNGNITVSTAKTPFLDCLRSYLIRYPNITDPHAPEWDVADAVVAAVYGAREVWTHSGSPLHASIQQKQAIESQGISAKLGSYTTFGAK